jgi:hypothetical protein
LGKKKGEKEAEEAKEGDFSEKGTDYEDFYSLLFGDQPSETLDETMVEKAKVEVEGKFLDSLKVINEEILQLSEFLIEDKKLAQELCKLIKPVLKHLNLSFVISPRAISLFEKTDQIILNEEGSLIFIHDKNKVDSKALEEYPPEIILIVFLDIIPKLGKLLKLYRKKVGMRVNFFEKIYRELENVNRTFVTSNQRHDESLEESVEVDGVKKVLFSKGKDYEGKPASSNAEPT